MRGVGTQGWACKQKWQDGNVGQEYPMLKRQRLHQRIIDRAQACHFVKLHTFFELVANAHLVPATLVFVMQVSECA